MTTPERLRRRQRIEGVFLFLLGIAIAWQSWVFDNRDEQNDRCIADQFSKLSETLSARGDLAQRESNAVAKVLITAANAKESQEVADALRVYDKERRVIAQERADNPLPEFPTGKCEDGAGASTLHQSVEPWPELPALDADDNDRATPPTAPDVRPMATTTGTGGRGSEERRPRSRQPDGRDDPDPRPPSNGGRNGGGNPPPGSPVDELFGTADDALDMTEHGIRRVADVVEDELPEPGNDCEEAAHG